MTQNNFCGIVNCPAPPGVKIDGGADTRGVIEGLTLAKTAGSDFVLGVRPLDPLSRSVRAHVYTRLKESGLGPGHPGQNRRRWSRRLKPTIRRGLVSTPPVATKWRGVGQK